MKSNPIKWHGGKQYLAKWILDWMPSHTHYTEPYAGGLAVLLARDGQGISETVNDVDGDLTNFWRVLASPKLFPHFERRVAFIPLSESVWEKSLEPTRSALGSAVKFFVRYRQSRQGLGKDYCTPTRRTRRGMNEQCSAWLSAVDGLPEAHERLRRVEVRNMPAVDFLQRYDHAAALHYLDPPYLHQTRTAKDAYREFEMSERDHRELLEVLSALRGRFMLSGYPSKMYSDWARRHGYNRHQKSIDNKASSKKSKDVKLECLWTNF